MALLDLPSPIKRVATDDLAAISSHEFKETLARLASGLAIVSCWRDGRPEGLLVNSITGLSVEPPRFLFCVRKEASAHDALAAAAVCGVNILSAEDESEAEIFTAPDRRSARFQSSIWTKDPKRPPLLVSALSAATCQVDQVIDADGHSILIVTVRHARRRFADALLSYNRKFHRFAGHDLGPDGLLSAE